MTKQKSAIEQLKFWIAGARPRTLGLSVAPVALGASAMANLQAARWDYTLLALAVALSLQIGVNYANDYSDGIRGTDKDRKGPKRITASGKASPRSVLIAAWAFFGLAALLGLVIVVLTQIWWLLAIGAVAILAAWFYTGGKRPYGYYGLGELSAFAFFGPIPAVFTAYIMNESWDGNALVAGVGAGCYAAAVMLSNNMRDLETDRAAGKRSLAVLIGLRPSKALYLVLIWLPIIIVGLFMILFPATLAGMLTLLLVLPLTLIVTTAKKPSDYLTLLKLTAWAGLGYGLTLAWGIANVVFR